MENFKRAFYNFIYYKKRNIILILLFTGVFYMLLAVMFIGIASKHQMDVIESSMGNGVFVKKVRVEQDLGRDSVARFTLDEIKTLGNDSTVSTYNVFVKQAGVFADIQPYIKDKKRYKEYLNYLESIGASLDNMDNCTFVGVTDSATSVLFAGADYQLVEGKPITQADSGKNVVLISEEVAELNHLRVGDMIRMKTAQDIVNYRPQAETDMTIQGIYRCPEEGFVTDNDYAPFALQEDYVFAPWETLYGLDDRSYQPLFVFVYLNDMSQAEQYVSNMNISLGETVDDFTEIGYTARYDYDWDGNWYDVVSAPLSEVGRAAQIMSLVIGCGALVSLVLVCAWLLRIQKHSMGIYLAIGVKKTGVLVQILTEELLVIAAALILACILGNTTAPAISREMMKDTSSEISSQMEAQRELKLFYQGNSEHYSLEKELRLSQFSFLKPPEEVNLKTSRREIAIFIIVLSTVIVIFLSIQICLILRDKPVRILQVKE